MHQKKKIKENGGNPIFLKKIEVRTALTEGNHGPLQ